MNPNERTAKETGRMESGIQDQLRVLQLLHDNEVFRHLLNDQRYQRFFSQFGIRFNGATQAYGVPLVHVSETDRICLTDRGVEYVELCQDTECGDVSTFPFFSHSTNYDHPDIVHALQGFEPTELLERAVIGMNQAFRSGQNNPTISDFSVF